MSEIERTPFLAREALITGAMLALAVALAWGWLFTMDTAAPSHEMSGMQGMAMGEAGGAQWTPAYAFAVFLMWAIMMVAMMLPSAAPMMMLYARVASGQAGGRGIVAPTFVFVAGYVAVWAAFSLAATGLQWTLAKGGLLTPMLALGDTTLGGLLIVGAGLYQLTPLKRICLSNCRAPLTFLTLYWRPGVKGALGMGLRHGAFCVGCCWFVMALLFVGGVMNLAWVAAIAAFVLAEKVLPFGAAVGQIAGAAAVAIGGYLVGAGVLA